MLLIIDNSHYHKRTIVIIDLISMGKSIPRYSPSEVVRIIKSITAKEMFKRKPEIKKKLWGGQFWSKGYFISTVGQYTNEEVIKKYVSNQGKEIEYKRIKKYEQLSMFESEGYNED